MTLPRPLEPGRANRDNLTALWRAQGSAEVTLPSGGVLHVSESWPDRLWVPFGAPLSTEDRARWGEVLAARERPGQVALWEAADEGGTESPPDSLDPAAPDLGEVPLERGAVLTAMDLDLAADGDVGSRWPEGPGGPFRIEPVGARRDAWVAAGSEAFGYRIEPGPVALLAADPRAELWLALEGERVVGTGLAFTTGDTVGLHQLGVVPAARRRGLAGEVLRHLLRRARDAGARRVTLQASAMGEGLYRREGFVPVGRLHLHRPRRP